MTICMSLKNTVKWNKPNKRVYTVWVLTLCEALDRKNRSVIAIRTVVGLGWGASKGTQRKFLGWWECAVYQLGWGSHEWMHLSKRIKLYSRNLHLLYVNYVSIKCAFKRRKFLSALPPPPLPFPEETTIKRLCALLCVCAHRCSQRNVVVVILLGRSVYVNGSILWVSSAPCFGERVLMVLVELPRSFSSCGSRWQQQRVAAEGPGPGARLPGFVNLALPLTRHVTLLCPSFLISKMGAKVVPVS